MAIVFFCSHCGAKHQTKDEYAGKQVRCPKCSGIVAIPGPSPQPPATKPPKTAAPPVANAPPAPVAPPAVPLPSAESEFDFDTPSPRMSAGSAKHGAGSSKHSPGKRRKGAWRWIAVGTGSLALVAAAGFGVWKVAFPTPAKVDVKPPLAAQPADAWGDMKNLADMVEKLQDGVVQITAIDRFGEKIGLGTGFVVNKSGLIATNLHVIEKAHSATVTFHDGTKTEVAGVRATDESHDLAILSLVKTPAKLIVLHLAHGAKLRVGAEVVALGHPLGLEFTVSTGIISAVRSTFDLPDIGASKATLSPTMEWIQTTAAISPGNSGGPLLSPRGDVVGINTMVYAVGQNLNFAGHVKHLDQLLRHLGEKTIALNDYAKERAEREARRPKPPPPAPDIGALLAAALQASEQLGWKPKTADDYQPLQFLGLLHASAIFADAAKPQVAEAEKALTAVPWDGKAQVAPINGFVQAFMSKPLPRSENGQPQPVGVLAFGNVVSLIPDVPAEYVVELIGEPAQFTLHDMRYQTSKDALKVGDHVMFLGVYVGNVQRTKVSADGKETPVQLPHVESSLVRALDASAMP